MMMMSLQSFLTEAEHEEIDEVSRQPMLEEQTNIVGHTVGGHVAARIPNTGFKWIFQCQFSAVIEHFAPCDFFVIGT